MAEQRMNADELLSFCQWQPVQIDLTQHAQLSYRRSDTRRDFTLGESQVALQGRGGRFVVFPPQIETCCVVRMKGLLKRRLEIEAIGPHRADLEARMTQR